MAPLLGLSTVEAAILQGAELAKYVATTMFIGLWLCRILLAYITLSIFHCGLFGMFGAIYLDFGSRTILYYFKMHKGDWKQAAI